MNHKGTKSTEKDRRPKKKEDASQLTSPKTTVG